MKVNNKELYNKVHYTLINLNKTNNNIKYDQLFTLYDSVLNSLPNKKSHNLIKNSISNTLTNLKDSKKQNLINQIIREKTNADRINLFHKSNRYNTNIRQEKLDNSFKYKLNQNINNKTFITNTYIQKYKPKSSGKIIEKEKVIHMGKSINDILIKSINDEMINKGILIQMPISAKKIKNMRRASVTNYNNYEKHMEVFEKKMRKEFGDYLKEYKLAGKKSLKSVSKKLADKKINMTKSIPIYVKGFKKNSVDIFHSRKIFDLEYQKFYRKPSVNIEEILHYQNKNGYTNFKKGKIPFYYFLRTVNNPYDKKPLFKKRQKTDKISIEFNEEEKN